MILQAGKFHFSFDRPLIMGIVNVTPDSFSDGGEFFDHDMAIEHALRLVEEGADILDVGGESTRPGAQDIPISEELHRVLPVLEALASNNLPVSIDTQKAAVMKEAVKAGVCMINDVNALHAEGALEVVAHSDAAICLMHRKGTAKTMQLDPCYIDLIGEIKAYLLSRAEVAHTAGIDHARIVIDPGFGFGKTQSHNIALVRALPEFAAMGFPVLAGLSRKRMLGEITGRLAGERLAASIAAAIIAVQNGAAIVRVHDVAATKDALAVISALTPAEDKI